MSFPLVEIITDHQDCTNPYDLHDLALLLGLGLRASKKGVRGIGSVRQDVNISIRGGTRVELNEPKVVRRGDQLITYRFKNIITPYNNYNM